jgi:hypothetical protein
MFFSSGTPLWYHNQGSGWIWADFMDFMDMDMDMNTRFKMIHHVFLMIFEVPFETTLPGSIGSTWPE